MIITHEFREKPKVDISEVYRYLGIKGEAEEQIAVGVAEALEEAGRVATPRSCYLRIPICKNKNTLNLKLFEVKSNSLAKHLRNSGEAFLFAATLGAELDMLINRYSLTKPVKAVYFQAIGAAMIEAVCDTLEKEVFSKAGYLTSRYSPGYGDFDISYQKELFKALDTQRKIGLYLTEGGLMVPTKSVTAIIGISSKEEIKIDCENCDINCMYKVVKK